MKIFITGGTGFIGTALTHHFLNKGFEVTVTGSSPVNRSISHSKYTYISADTSQKGDWQDSVRGVDAIINLAGRTIFKPWTRRYKKKIYDSRIQTTRNIVESIPESNGIILCSASAAGYYGDKGDEALPETREPGNDFLAKVCVDWEKEAFKAEETGARVTVFRLGVVLGKNGGAVRKMLPAFKFFLGGPLGNGKQWFPWIHLDDVLSALELVIEDHQIKGPMNFCSPGTVQHQDFASELGRILNRPAFLRVPAFFLRLFMGELGGALLNSQKAIPEKLTRQGYRFKFSKLGEALSTVI